MCRVNSLIAALIGMTCVISPVAAGELLRWKWQTGDQLQIELKQTSDQQTTLGAQELIVSGIQRLTMVWTVDEVTPAGDAKLILTVKRIQLDLNLGDLGQVVFDSDVQQEPTGLARTLAGPLRSVLGANIAQLVSAAGEITETVLPETTRQSLDAHPLARPLVHRLLADVGRQSAFKLPAHELELDEEWQNAGELMTELGPVPMLTTYQYRGKTAKATGDLDLIDVRFRLGPDAAELTAKSPLKVIEQESSGTIWFDNQLGRLASAHFVQQQTIDVGMDEQRVVQKLKKVTDITIEPAVPPAPSAVTETPDAK